jgi:hypothetical protein
MRRSDRRCLDADRQTVVAIQQVDRDREIVGFAELQYDNLEYLHAGFGIARSRRALIVLRKPSAGLSHVPLQGAQPQHECAVVQWRAYAAATPRTWATLRPAIAPMTIVQRDVIRLMPTRKKP